MMRVHISYLPPLPVTDDRVMKVLDYETPTAKDLASRQPYDVLVVSDRQRTAWCSKIKCRLGGPAGGIHHCPQILQYK
jgi:hypothetical protein